MRAKRGMQWTVWLVCVALLAACASGPVRRVSEPSARIQQLTVGTDGRWTAELRIENFSSIKMRFDAVQLVMRIAGADAATLSVQPGLTIGPESADVLSVAIAPSVAAKLAVADALAGRKGVDYSLAGTVSVTPDEQRQREFKIERASALSPAPGLPGVLR
ncbi:MAG: hypothetical protein ABIO84_04905 [Lysobacter sp.]